MRSERRFASTPSRSSFGDEAGSQAPLPSRRAPTFVTSFSSGG